MLRAGAVGAVGRGEWRLVRTWSVDIEAVAAPDGARVEQVHAPPLGHGS